MGKAFTLPSTEEGHHAPPRTVMQGSVLDGVDGGYEERDVKFAPLMMWAGAILGMALTAMVVVWGMLMVMMDVTNKETAAMNPVLKQVQIPPEPRLIPNRPDSLRPENIGKPLQMPIEWGEDRRREQQAEAAAHGLFSLDEGVAFLPPDTVAAVIAQNSGAPVPSAPTVRVPLSGTSYAMPSDSSGGLEVENKLQ